VAGSDPFAAEALELLETLVPIVRENPGIIQTEIYKRMPEFPRQQVSYALYLGSKNGNVLRKKKGSTYALFVP
jgi:hypothetical protein